MRALADNPELLQQITLLKNWEIREAAIYHGIDVGQMHVGSRQGLGEAQVSRQDLIRQMLQKGVKPEQILEAAKQPVQTIPIEQLREGDTFVDKTGEPRRIVEITPGGKIRTADGTALTFQGGIEIRGELNSTRAQLARGGKFIEGKEQDVSQKLIENAKNEFGTTNDPRESGWILPEGDMLDFSGKKEGGSGGMRAYDHRDIARAFPEDEKIFGYNNAGGAHNAFEKNTGAIRMSIHSDNFAFDLNEKRPPTPAQLQQIRRIIAEVHPENLTIDRYQDGQYYGSVEKAFPQPADADRLIGGRKEPPAPPPLRDVPAPLQRWLEPDEIEFLQGRPLLQKNVAKAYNDLKPSLAEVVNVARAGHGLGGWWQRFMDTFAALGEPTEGMENMPLNHVENLKAFHGALSGNKAVEQANRIAWGAYRDWLDAGRPTDLRSINRIVTNNRGISGRGGLDTQKLFKLVNSPQMKEGAAFTGEAFVRSPVAGVTPGAKKIPSMVATTAGTGNLKRVVFDTHMKDLYGLNGLTDAQYLAASIHIRQAGEMLGFSAGEAQEQMWGTVLGLKQLLGRGLSAKAAAQRYGRDILASIGKDYAEVILESMQNDPEVRQIMEDLKKFGFDPGGPVATEKLERIVEQGRQRMAEPAPRLSRQLLTRTARRIASSRAGP